MKCSILRIPLLLLAWNLLLIMPLSALPSDGLSVPSGQDPAQEGLKPIEEFLGNKTVGVMTGSLGEILLTEQYPQVPLQRYDDIMDAIAALLSMKLDYVLTAYTTAFVAVRNNSGLQIVPRHLTNEGAGVAVSKENKTGLLRQIDSVLTAFKSDGTLEEIVGHWIRTDGTDYVVPDFPQENFPGSPLIVGTAANREPICFIRNNRIAGLDWELMMRIGQALGRKVQFEDMKYAALIAALQSGKIDAIASNMTATAERKKQVDFSQVYFMNPQVLVERSQAKTVSRDSFFHRLADSFRNNVLKEKRYLLILNGLKVTLIIALCSVVLGTLLGAGICFMRMSRRRFYSGFAKAYILFFRAIPQVVTLMIMFYVIFSSVKVSGVVVSVITFALIFASYSSELFRTSLQSIPVGQKEAGYALGFSKVQTFFNILLPQAARVAFPVYKGEIISLVKMTAIVGYVAVQDLTKAGDIIRSRTFDAFFPLVLTAIIYLIIIWLLTRLMDAVARPATGTTAGNR